MQFGDLRVANGGVYICAVSRIRNDFLRFSDLTAYLKFVAGYPWTTVLVFMLAAAGEA